MAESLEGVVIRRLVHRGSKSEHRAVILQCEDADVVLRRRGGNAFSDPVLEALVGKRIRATGDRIKDLFILSGWEALGCPKEEE